MAAETGRRVLVTTADAVDMGALSAAVGAGVTADGDGRYLVAAGPEAIPAISAWFAEHGLRLTGITSEGSLEQAFLRLTAREVRT